MWSLLLLLPGSLAVFLTDNGAAQCPPRPGTFGTGQLIGYHLGCSSQSAFCLSDTEKHLCNRGTKCVLCSVIIQTTKTHKE